MEANIAHGWRTSASYQIGSLRSLQYQNTATTPNKDRPTDVLQGSPVSTEVAGRRVYTRPIDTLYSHIRRPSRVYNNSGYRNVTKTSRVDRWSPSWSVGASQTTGLFCSERVELSDHSSRGKMLTTDNVLADSIRMPINIPNARSLTYVARSDNTTND